MDIRSALAINRILDFFYATRNKVFVLGVAESRALFLMKPHLAETLTDHKAMSLSSEGCGTNPLSQHRCPAFVSDINKKIWKTRVGNVFSILGSLLRLAACHFLCQFNSCNNCTEFLLWSHSPHMHFLFVISLPVSSLSVDVLLSSGFFEYIIYVTKESSFVVTTSQIQQNSSQCKLWLPKRVEKLWLWQTVIVPQIPVLNTRRIKTEWR